MPATVLGLTGSVGKTTTKDLTASILEELGETLATQGNLNNHIGVPLTLLRLRPEHELAVIEMGCNDFGEIAALAELARPTIGLVTAVAPAHLEKLVDLEGVARAKGELFAALPAEGMVVVNLDDSRVRTMASPARRRLGYGRDESAEVRLGARRTAAGQAEFAQEIELELAGRGSLRVGLRLLGEHNARNAAAAAALALAAGASPEAIASGLRRVEAPAGRLRLRAGAGGLRVIDDTYNANPESTAAALSVAVEARGRAAAWLVMGAMAELGPATEEAHRRVGALAAEAGLAGLVGVGAAAEAICAGARAAGMTLALAAEAPDEAAALVSERAAADDVVLVKGSRAARMERAVAALCRD
jgi:UDP-N-acetylmuramoyl-tripeptide--D-alanyl-D-alanine ligase